MNAHYRLGNWGRGNDIDLMGNPGSTGKRRLFQTQGRLGFEDLTVSVSKAQKRIGTEVEQKDEALSRTD